MNLREVGLTAISEETHRHPLRIFKMSWLQGDIALEIRLSLTIVSNA